ncbi:hypothetical protein RX825_28195, partial [Pseudomonas syringae pv. actinidiae]|nr:hypothetical protein [Pseudomonas syringae pv. actinidiae]
KEPCLFSRLALIAQKTRPDLFTQLAFSRQSAHRPHGNLVRTGYLGGRRCRTGSANGGGVW